MREADCNIFTLSIRRRYYPYYVVRRRDKERLSHAATRSYLFRGTNLARSRQTRLNLVALIRRARENPKICEWKHSNG